MTENPAPPPAAPKKMSGCLLAALVVGGICGLFCLVGGFMFWRATQSDAGKKVFAMMGKGVELAKKGMTAPGAAELRAAGCPEAMVMNPAEMIEAFSGIFDAGMERDDAKAGAVMVLCQGNTLDTLPECDALAAVYVTAVHPTAEFTVQVRQQSTTKPRCSKTYAADGKFVSESE